MSAVGLTKSNRFARFTALGLVIFFVAAYAITIGLYANSGCGCPLPVTQGQSAADGTTVTIDVVELQSMKGALVANISVAPGPGLVDPVTRGLSEDFAVVVHSAVTPSKRTWTKGMLPGDYPVPLTISGDPSSWPLDRCHSGPITADLIYGTNPIPEQVPARIVDRLAGWKVAVAGDGKPSSAYRVEVRRSPSIAAFAAVILSVMVVLAAAALFVAIQTIRNKRKFQPPMTTWYAAMLFAVIPLRNALPDAPPVGSWVDVTVTLWVIVVLAMSMLLYVFCWWRHLRPEPDNPA